MNQRLEYFFIYYRQKDWPEQLVSVEFVVNSNIYSATKISLFMANYGRELMMRVDIRIKEKAEKAMKFLEKIKRIQEKTETVLKKAQEEMKRQANKRRREVVV